MGAWQRVGGRGRLDPMHRLRACLLALAILPLGGWEPLWRSDPDVIDGNRAYQDGRYDDALAAYDRAEDAGVDVHGLDYDRGTTNLAKAEAGPEGERSALREQAIEQLENAKKSKDPKVRARAHYNVGNLHMKVDQLGDAIAEYKDALRNDPTLEAARSNLELALRKRQRQQQQQQQKRQGQGQGQGQNQQPQPQPGRGQGQGQPQPGQGQQPQPGQQGQPGQGQPQPGQPGNQNQPQPGQPGGQQGQPAQQGPGTRRMPQAQWPRDDTSNDTPDLAPGAKLDQLEDMSRQLRRDQIRQKNDGGGRPTRDW